MPVSPEKPAYPAAEFEKNLPAWRDMIAAGKQTADRLIAMLQSKATFTEEQLAAIRKKDDTPKAAEPAPAAVEGELVDDGPIDWSQPGTGAHS